VIQLANPLFLLGGLLLLPWLVQLRRTWHYSSLYLLQGGQRWHPVHLCATGVTYIAIILLLLALARPQWGITHAEQVREVRDIVLTLDVSLSMNGFIASSTRQQAVQKLDVIQQAALEFVRRRPHDRLGLLVFGDDAFGAWPLTTNKTTLEYRLQHLKTILPADLRGTNVAQAFIKSLDYLHEHGQAESQLLLLLTDGLDNIEPAVEAQIVQRLRQNQVTVYVLGIELQEDSPLMQLTRRVQGQYVNVNNAEEVDRALRDIDRLEASQVTLVQHTEAKDLYAFFVVSGLVLLTASVTLKSTWALEV
jgi:Ca-activated chloride channel family protein